jgi:hypothetical protein
VRNRESAGADHEAPQNSNSSLPEQTPSEDKEAESKPFRVQVVQNTARSKNQLVLMRERLERQGFSVTVREYFTEGNFQADYYATLFGEKQVPADARKVELEKEADQPEFIADREFGHLAKAFWWALVLIGLFIWFYFSFPLLKSIMFLFK